MRNLATKTKGRFYNVTNPKALPRIYQKEARSISRPLIFEQTTPWLPKLNYPITEPVMGLPEELPAITGLVLTSPKENELVEIPIVSPLPTGQVNPVLAHWTYGLGRSVAFTIRRRPAVGQGLARLAELRRVLVAGRSAGRCVRPTGATSRLNVRREQGRIKVVVDALDKNNEFLNFLQIQGNVVNPDLKSASVELVQIAPGRYEATIENAEASGNYFVNLGYRGPDKVQGVISTGVSVPYSDEYRELRSNPATLETLASLTDGQVVLEASPTAGWTCLVPSRRRPLPPRPQADQSPLVRRALADPALAGGLPVPGRRRRPPDRARRRLAQASRGQRMEEAPRSGDRDGQRIHGQAQEPQGRGRRAARPHPLQPPAQRQRRCRFPDAPPSGSIGEPLWKGERSHDRARAAQKTQSPSLATPLAGDRETELHRPPAQGQAARLGRTGERIRNRKRRTP